nr:MAG TPA: hypothetical protein [Caudoviricetes sp.]
MSENAAVWLFIPLQTTIERAFPWQSRNPKRRLPTKLLASWSVPACVLLLRLGHAVVLASHLDQRPEF